MDLLHELMNVVSALDRAGIPYALCGGLALAVYGRPRATMDMDLLVPPGEVDKIKEEVRPLGFTMESEPLDFAEGRVRLRRLIKLDPRGEEPLLLDLVLVTPALESVWEGRQAVEWEYGRLQAVSPGGLRMMKRLKGSFQDQADLEVLEKLYPVMEKAEEA